MNKDIKFENNQAQIRKLAEEKINNRLGNFTSKIPSEVFEYIRELQSNQIEIENQNEELRKSHIYKELGRDKYHKLFSEMIDGAALHEIICDKNGKPIDYITLEVNNKYELLLNTKREFIIGKNASELLPDNELNKWLEIFGPVALTGLSTKYEMYSPANKKYFEGNVYCPEIGKFAVNFADVSERNSAQHELEISEKNLKKAQHYAHLGSWTWNIKTNQLDWSDEMFGLFGINKQTFTGYLPDVISKAIHPEDREKVAQSSKIVISNGKSEPLEYRVIWPDGSIHDLWAEAGELLLDEKGNPFQLSGFVQDVTTVKSEEQALRYSKDKLKKLVDAELFRIQELNALNLELKNARIATLNIIEDLSNEVEEHKHAEEEIKSQRNTLLAIFESSPNIMVLVDKEGRIKNINREGIEFAAKEKSLLLDQLGGDVFNCLNSFKMPGCGRNAECSNCPIRSRVSRTIISGETIHNGEGRMTFLVDGKKVNLDLLVSTSLVKRDEGDLVLITIVDITERKKAELALQDAQALTNAIVDSTSDMIWSVDSENFSLLTFNYGLSEYFFKHRGIRMQAGMLPEQLFTTDNSIRTWENFYQRALSEAPYTVEYHIYSDSQVLQLTFNLLKRDNKVIGISVFGKDITDTITIEKEIKRYRENLEELVKEKTQQLTKQNIFFRTLLDTIPNPIYVEDTGLRITEVNKAYEEFIGITRENILGKTNFDIVQIESANLSKKYDEKLLRDHNTVTYETFKPDVGKGTIPLLIYKSSFGLPGKKPEGITALIIDISNQKEMEKTTLEALNKEKVLNEMKSSFISMASHEFRTPLTTILSSTDLLEAHHKKWDEQKIVAHFKKIQSSVQYMISMLDEVLTISRSDRGKIEFHPTLLNLKEFCAGVIQEAKLQATPKHKLLFRNKVKFNNIIADTKLLNHILSNLLTNAIKFSPDGGNVLLMIEDEDEFIKFTVKDNGIGIPPEDINNLFEPFFRAKNTAGIKGTGLGLSIVKRYIQLHSGEILIDSKPGKGTKFIVKIKNNYKFNKL
jgi:PAS domain S-box-containing protein